MIKLFKSTKISIKLKNKFKQGRNIYIALREKKATENQSLSSHIVICGARILRVVHQRYARIMTTTMTMTMMVVSRFQFFRYLRYCRTARQRTSERTRQGCEWIEEGHSNRTYGRSTVPRSRFPSSRIQVQALIGFINRDTN